MKKNLFTIMLAFLVVFGVNAQDFGRVTSKSKVAQDVQISKSMKQMTSVKGVIFSDDFEADNGWTLDADWTRGIPTVEPTSAYSGTNILGGPLDADYTSSQPTMYATSPVIDCSAETAVTLTYQSFSGCESATWDHISVEVYDGSAWVSIWDNSVWGGSNQETEWTFYEFDVTAQAAGNANFQVRFVLGTSDSSVQYSGWAIDDFALTFPEPHDLGVVAVTPTFVLSGETVTPQVTIQNFGSLEEAAYNVTLTDGDAYTSDIDFTTAIAAGTTLVLDMADYTPADGTYTLTATVTVASDANTANNVMAVSCDVLELSYDLGYNYGWSAYGTYVDNSIKNNVSTGVIEPIASGTPSGFLIAGDYINGIVYGIAVSTNDVYIVNGDGALYQVGTVSGTDVILGFAYDNDNDIVYAIDSNDDLYTINMNDFSGTLVGNVGYGCFGIAYAGGVLYGVESGNSDLISINVNTAAGTVIGNTGLSLNYAQDIGSDKVRGLLYGTLYTSSGGFYSIDVTTGAATLINDFGDEVTMCAVVPAPLSTVATLSDLTVDGTTVTGFDAATMTYAVELPYETTIIPTVAGVATDANATVTVTQATDLAGDEAARTATVNVVAEDGSTSLDYTVVFTVAAAPTTAPITFIVDNATNNNPAYTGFALKGSWDATGAYDNTWNGGAEQSVFYDDGTHGDLTASDNIYTVVLDLVFDGGANSWEWGVNDQGGNWIDGNFGFTVTDATPQTLTYEVPSGINDIAAKGISVYPNPSNGTFTVNVESNFNLEVLDITGKVINTRVLNGNSTVKINNAGVYFLRFSNEEGSVTQKVIVQ